MEHQARERSMQEVLPMTGGSGATSYAANSRLQEKEISRTKLLIEEAVKEVYTKTLPENFMAADIGCSCGPNTFLPFYMIVHTLGDHCHQLSQKSPEIQYFLNDLPENDFNNLFKNMEFLKLKIEQEKEDIASVPNYYVCGVPGTFYGRLFPSNSVHFFHSSYCLHWLSKVPDGVKNEEGDPLNKENIHIAKTSTPNIIKSYHEQFRSDFSNFLDLRYKELVNGGRMVLTLLGRKNTDARYGEVSYLYGLLADALKSMDLQGLLQEGKVESFNIPCYMPSVEEVKEVIIEHGSFLLHRLYTVVSNWDPNDDSINIDHESFIDNAESGKNVAKSIRAVHEPILARHFGNAIIDDLFARFAGNVDNHFLKEKGMYTVIVVSLVK